FGVAQRALLKQSGIDPHYLVMTATPIPRTMSMTLFGDLDTSTLRAAPPGRQPVHTYFATEHQRDRWWEFFRKKLREGRQGYVVTPLVDESDDLQLASVQQTFESLAHGELADFRLDFLHGRMSSSEKEFVMQNFRTGRTQVLVATPVIEVGVDIANATLMTIEAGDRFGLAQLHQLRGRVSRGAHPGYVCVFGDPKTEEAHARLEAFTQSTDGFELAEIDFRLRGPGDLFGKEQHGLPPLRIANLQQDAAILEEARRDAQALFASDPQLANPDFARLRKMAISRYGGALELSDVG
ncbi:MAG TPA: helicase-related protein, partial [Pirellulaceae bacterium]|nr:helicase-related protein [Pirellulaceae bacterium]